MDCPKCSASVENDATFCNSCGFKLSGDGQILSTNAVVSIQDKSKELFNRVTYSTLTKVIFFSTLLALFGGILSMFSLVEGAFLFAMPSIVMVGTIIYRAIKTFVDIDTASNESLAQEIRLLLTFFAYSLFLIVFAGIVIGVAMLVGSWKYTEVITVYSGLIFEYAGLMGFSLLIISMIYMITSVRKSQS